MILLVSVVRLVSEAARIRLFEETSVEITKEWDSSRLLQRNSIVPAVRKRWRCRFILSAVTNCWRFSVAVISLGWQFLGHMLAERFFSVPD